MTNNPRENRLLTERLKENYLINSSQHFTVANCNSHFPTNQSWQRIEPRVQLCTQKNYQKRCPECVVIERCKARFIRRTLHEPNLIPIKVDPNN